MKILVSNAENIMAAVTTLQAGDLIGMPTETVYGLAGDACSDVAVKKIYTVKGRPAHNPLIVHWADTASAMQYGIFNAAARALASVFWPGPLTLVVTRDARAETKKSLAACFLSLQTIALRVPSHPVAQSLLHAFEGPLAAPSANRSGQLSPTQATHVAAAFDGMDQPKIILANGRTEAGLESTIVDCSGDVPRILRPGSITHEQLCAVVPEVLEFNTRAVVGNAPPIAPGQLDKHYAPRTKLRLNAAEIFDGEVLLAFGREPLWARRALQVLNLSDAEDLTEAAHQLFSHLHILDGIGASRIAVMPVPNEGIGVAINDRLRRAATST